MNTHNLMWGVLGVVAGLLIGLFIGAMMATQRGRECNKAMDQAVESSYVVHDGKAYRVIPVDSVREVTSDDQKTECSPPVTIEGVTWPGVCPSGDVEVGDMVVPMGSPCLDNGDWGVTCLSDESWM